MAVKTRAEMIDRTMRLLGVLGAGQTASGDDAVLVGDVIDSVHAELQSVGLCSFAIAEFPEWAQEGFAKVAAEELAPYFGKDLSGFRAKGEGELRRQMGGSKTAPSVEIDFF